MVLKVYDEGGCVGCPPEIGCLHKLCPMLYTIEMRCDIH